MPSNITLLLWHAPHILENKHPARHRTWKKDIYVRSRTLSVSLRSKSEHGVEPLHQRYCRMGQSALCLLVLAAMVGHIVYGQDPLVTCGGPADIVFAVDGSDSVTDEQFDSIIKLIDKLLDQMNMANSSADLNGDNIRSAALVYSTGENFRLYWNYFNLVTTKKEFRDAIELLKIGRTPMGSDTHYGIKQLRKLLTDSPKPGVPLIGVVITDGRSTRARETTLQAQAAKLLNKIHMVSIGVGFQIDEGELSAIASSKDDVIINRNFQELDSGTFSRVNLRLCEIATTAATTTTTTPPPTTTSTTPTTTTSTLPPTTTTTVATTTTSATTPPETTAAPRRPAPQQSPTQAPIRRGDMVRQLTDSELCTGCQIDQWFGYNYHPRDCQLFVQCHMPSNNTIVAKVRYCGYGKMWSHDSLTCVNYDDPTLKCYADMCAGKADTDTYAMACSCRGYWTCRGGKTLAPNCCPIGQRFDDAIGCVEDNTCVDLCDSSDEPMNVHDTLCDKEAISDNVHNYRLKFYGGSIQSCAPGTVFDSVSCQCLHDPDFKQSIYGCRPLVNFPFNITSKFEDISGNFAYGHPEHVTVDAEGAYFDGTGYFLIHSLSYRDFQNTMVIRFELRPDTTTNPSGTTETVLTNCFWCDYDVQSGSDPSSIHVKVMKYGNVPVLQARVKTTDGERSKSADTSSPSSYGWHEDIVVFQGNAKSGNKLVTYGGMTANIELETDLYDRIVRAQSGFVLGRSPLLNGNNFVGHIRNFRVYDCIPDDIPTQLKSVLES
ncbi:hypothetical protein ScPMuIL_017140 [Solemya velum]